MRFEGHVAAIGPAVLELVHMFPEFAGNLMDWTVIWHSDVYVCTFVLLFFGVICAAAGIGGGGVIVTVLMFFGKLSPRDAVPLSKAIVFLGSIVSLSLNAGKRVALSSKNGGKEDEVNLIDLRILKALIPTSLIGTLIGVLTNQHAPGWGIVCALLCTLLIMLFSLCRKGLEQYQEEMAAKEAQTKELGAKGDEEDPEERKALLSSTEKQVQQQQQKQMPNSQEGAEGASDGEASPAAAGDVAAGRQLADAKGKNLDRQNCCCTVRDPGEWNCHDGCLLGFMLLVVIAGGVLRHHVKNCAEERHPSGTELVGPPGGQACRHPLLWALFGSRMENWLQDEGFGFFITESFLVVPIWLCVLIAMFFAYEIVFFSTMQKENEARNAAAAANGAPVSGTGNGTELRPVDAPSGGAVAAPGSGPGREGDHQAAEKSSSSSGEWSHQRVALYQSVGLATGLLAGLVGIGGGLIFSPFLLVTGVDPSIAVATSATCVIFTSSSTTFQYLLIGRVQIPLACFYGVVNCVASYLGTSLVHYLSVNYVTVRRSAVTFVVVLGVLASTVLSCIKLVDEVSPHAHQVLLAYDPHDTIVVPDQSPF